MTQSPSPIFARPVFWGALLLLLLLAYAGWLIWLQWQAAETLKRGQALALERQIERNALLDAEAARLREALSLDPCLLRDMLRDMPNTGPWQDIPLVYPDMQDSAPPSGIQAEPVLPPAHGAVALTGRAMAIQARGK